MGLWNDRWVKNLHVHLPLGGKPQASYKPKLPTKKSGILSKRKTQISIGIWTLKIWFPRMLLHYISHFCLHWRMLRLFTVAYFFVRSFRYTTSYGHDYLDFQMYRGGELRVQVRVQVSVSVLVGVGVRVQVSDP